MKRVIVYSVLCLIWCGAAVTLGGGSMKACVALAAATGGGIWFCLAAWEFSGERV